ncbi:hypothetical protein T439DRAFT_327881 [Meredithblackwellia eburnea MCA 4105]
MLARTSTLARGTTRHVLTPQRTATSRPPASIPLRAYSLAKPRSNLLKTPKFKIVRPSQLSRRPLSTSVSPPAVPQTRWSKIKSLGAPAIVLYLLLSVVDFGLTFVLVSAIGAERVRQAEDWVLDKLEWRRKDGEPGKIKVAVERKVENWKENHGHHHQVQGGKKEQVGGVDASESKVENPPQVVLDSHDNARAPEGQGQLVVGTKEPSGYSAIATTAVLAYAIHKTVLLPVRVGLTVAITPRVVKFLQSYGWKIGVQAPQAAVAGAAGTSAVAK